MSDFLQTPFMGVVAFLLISYVIGTMLLYIGRLLDAITSRIKHGPIPPEKKQ